jgi:hypothetical protein
MSTNMPKSAWRVTGQQETVDNGPDGRVVRGYRIMFQSAKGHHGSVFIPAEQYNPNNVKAAVGSMAFQLDQVGDLQG